MSPRVPPHPTPVFLSLEISFFLFLFSSNQTTDITLPVFISLGFHCQHSDPFQLTPEPNPPLSYTYTTISICFPSVQCLAPLDSFPCLHCKFLSLLISSPLSTCTCSYTCMHIDAVNIHVVFACKF